MNKTNGPTRTKQRSQDKKLSDDHSESVIDDTDADLTVPNLALELNADTLSLSSEDKDLGHDPYNTGPYDTTRTN